MSKIGVFPVDWAGKRIIYFEPHSDDFFLNAYSIYKGIWMRGAENAPSGLTVVTISTSEANHENGLRSLMPKRSSMTFKQIELGFPDIVWDKTTREKFKSDNRYDFDIVSDTAILDWYNNRILRTMNFFQKVIYQIIDMEFLLYNKEIIVLSPLALPSAHPFHRIVRYAIQSHIVSRLWFYEDNPYTRNGDIRTAVGLQDNYIVDLDDMARARKFSMFCDHYSSQYTSQVVWNDAWMLKEEHESFWTPSRKGWINEDFIHNL